VRRWDWSVTAMSALFGALHWRMAAGRRHLAGIWLCASEFSLKRIQSQPPALLQLLCLTGKEPAEPDSTEPMVFRDFLP